MYSYSMADAFLGQVLVAKGAGSTHIMLALGVDGIATCAVAVMVLLCQSFPAVSGMALRPKWWLVVAGQAASVASSALPAVLPCTQVIIACRALHGAATAVYMVYCLILLVELAPQQHLALGIAVLSAGCSAGDSIGPVLARNRCSFESDAIPQVKDNRRYHHMVSAHDLEVVQHTKAAADAAAKQGITEPTRQPLTQQTLHQQQRLDMGSVLSTVGDRVVASQCLLVAFEQGVTAALMVLLPVVMYVPTWLVGLVYVAMVVGAVSGPFALEAYLSRRPAGQQKTYHLAVAACLLMGVSSTLLIPLAWCLPAVACLLFVFRASQAVTETLVYIHVAQRLETL
ncbi:hypothetical protein OEZ85_013239 [Tetradesmus obliquus]|uniref:Major facilitator superfamily (MFS) profile domain-containing protein n=1 Tax=Tetradesmus obliquus TaxID=3088 RepID=A0ABY8U536_TETOB|nr:hypothetical protein OEZ85_013239 [Tetradesmus obliquus]